MPVQHADSAPTGAVPQAGGPDPAAGAAVALNRRRTGTVLAGVSGGIADHLGVGVFWVRLVFAVLTGCSGAGVLAYGLCWIFIKQEPADAPVHQQGTKARQQAFALIALGIALVVLFDALSGLVGVWVVLPVLVALLGVAVVWREADDSTRGRWRSAAARGGLTRTALGAVLVAVGIGAFLLRALHLGQVPFALVAVLAALAGVVVLAAPWWLKLVRDLGEERRARIRTEEREEIAAHLHDSVLQTLALIQKQAEQPREVQRLARGQERELRNWLYGPDGYGREKADGAGNLAQALTVAAGEVEDTFAITVEPVVVGDCPLDHSLAALVLATREAMVNAAKHAGVDTVSLYAEVDAARVAVFVRDRGVGFDPEAVGEDRHGLADSVRGRMVRHGGEVALRTAPGNGTEVALTMPHHQAEHSAV
ncbi:MAG: ATP-binding protein [Sciscionella sp.]